MVEILVCSLSMSCVALRCAAFRGGGGVKMRTSIYLGSVQL